MNKTTLATVWLDGCSGCHMSFLDIDERLIELAPYIDLVYSPLVDVKEFPESVDVTLVEGAVSSTEDLHKITHIRAHTKTLISLGDCAVTANVPAMRNRFSVQEVEYRAYHENVATNPGTPRAYIPELLRHVQPVHKVVHVDIFVPGCPPSADVIYEVLLAALKGRAPAIQGATRFGA